MPQTLRTIVAGAAGPSARSPSALLATFAVAGSCIYGGSLALVLPGWNILAAAAWLAVSAGLAWIVFIPCLAKFARLPLLTCLQMCLVAMAAGEVVLVSGALVNGLLASRQLFEHAAVVNIVIVALSNVAMFGVLASVLLEHDIPIRRTAAWWMAILNGSGALFFAALHPLLHAP